MSDISNSTISPQYYYSLSSPNSDNSSETALNGLGAAWHRGVSYGQSIANIILGSTVIGFAYEYFSNHSIFYQLADFVSVVFIFAPSIYVPLIGGTLSVAVYAIEKTVQKLGQAGSSFMNAVSA